MSVQVLLRSAENVQARAEMRRQKLDFVSGWTMRALRKARLARGVSIGDSKKSWDLLKTAQFLKQNVDKSSPILDIGAFASEILCVLHELGYSDLTGMDLNPRLSLMPFNRSIKYRIGDFTNTPFADGAFGTVTAISVLEHGFCCRRVLGEVSRILKPGGYFVGSVDYWPTKVDTTGIEMFGLDWTIFSENELLGLISEAKRHGMFPVGHLDLGAGERIVRWRRKDYTFAWFAFQKVCVPDQKGDTNASLNSTL